MPCTFKARDDRREESDRRPCALAGVRSGVGVFVDYGCLNGPTLKVVDNWYSRRAARPATLKPEDSAPGECSSESGAGCGGGDLVVTVAAACQDFKFEEVSQDQRGAEQILHIDDALNCAGTSSLDPT